MKFPILGDMTMAKEYIDREAKCGDCIHAEVCETVKTLNEFSRENYAYCQKFKNSADVAPVVHGRWMLEREPDGKTYCFHCSACDSGFSYISIYNVGDWNYCPNCGAKMDGGEENAAD